MPDSKTAFEKALSQTHVHLAQPIPKEWDDEGGATTVEEIRTDKREYFKTTNNVTRTTFNYVRDNPGNTRTQIVSALETQGFKPSSTTSLVAQMIKQGLVRETNGACFAAQAEYSSLKNTVKRVEPVVHIKKKKAKPRSPFIPAAEVSARINAAWDAENLLNNLSIKQARALYDELRKIFGG